MKRILIYILFLILAVIAFYAVQMTANDPAKSAIQENANAPLLTKQRADPAASIKTDPDSPSKLPSAQTQPVIKANPAAQFDNLPEAMQQQIKTLRGRDNYDVQPIEVKPGVFIMPPDKNVRVVPVAVMNEDGTVSIHEY